MQSNRDAPLFPPVYIWLSILQVPNFSPRDVIENLRRRINGQAYVEMQPWYDGFAGTIEVQDLYSMSACLQCWCTC